MLAVAGHRRNALSTSAGGCYKDAVVTGDAVPAGAGRGRGQGRGNGSCAHCSDSRQLRPIQLRPYPIAAYPIAAHL
ncbi:protein of unknown function [Cupriavidus neocaledonicus]|uniref:Uncharacterized protein n=1 Tax=Cupriavidus neocaledonicus TaxID=1040979 RepID=A0A375H1A7_9BURK|nr:protein of unknown function [Cupriavidus neocaledonicus]